jgi:hypothetical protein
MARGHHCLTRSGAVTTTAQRNGKNNKYYKKVARLLLFMFMVSAGFFYCHRYMQHVYFTQCKPNVFMAVLYNKSAPCIQLHAVLYTIEHMCSRVMTVMMKVIFASCSPFLSWFP